MRNATTPMDRYKSILTSFLCENAASMPAFGRIEGYLRNNDWMRVYRAAGELSTEVFDEAKQHYLANQFGALVLKYPFDFRQIGLETDPKEYAIGKFYASERKCQITNRRFRRVQSVSWTRYHEVIMKARQYIERVIGNEPPLREIYSACAFGPGANVGVHGNATNLARKFFCEEGWSVTPSAVSHFRTALKSNWSFFDVLSRPPGCESHISCFDEEFVNARIDQRLKLVHSNKLSFVPKTAKTHRAIAVEPLGNSFLQTGIERVLKLRLCSIGIDLSNQERNQLKAKAASIDGLGATIDLSSASDTIAIEVVRALLPSEWFRLLNQTRSPAYRSLNSSEDVRYEKFSSMGNGFCFPLETLIFSAIVRATIPDSEFRKCAFYGDDLIVPSAHFSSVCNSLRFFGFTPNPEKSFGDGPFRESCGADWHRGTDVRPVYLDYALVDDVDLRIFHNATLRSEIVARTFQGIRPLIRSWSQRQVLIRPPLSKSLTGVDDYSDPLYNKNLNGAFTVPWDTFLASRSSRWIRATMSWSWREELYVPVRDHIAENSYPIARYWASLGGSPQGQLNLRRKTKRSIAVRQ